MSQSLKKENPVTAGPRKKEKPDLKQLKQPPLIGGWRAALAQGNGSFRKYGAYDHAPSGRATRRALVRLTKNKRGAK